MPGRRRVRKAHSAARSSHIRGRKKKRRTQRARKAKASRRAAPKKASLLEESEPVKHYGQSWEFEHYDKESLKASGLFL